MKKKTCKHLKNKCGVLNQPADKHSLHCSSFSPQWDGGGNEQKLKNDKLR